MRTTSRGAARVRTAIALACVRAAAVTGRRVDRGLLTPAVSRCGGDRRLGCGAGTGIVRSEFIDGICQTADNLAGRVGTIGGAGCEKASAADYSGSRQRCAPFQLVVQQPGSAGDLITHAIEECVTRPGKPAAHVAGSGKHIAGTR